MAFLSGKYGSISRNGVSLALKSWQLPIDCDIKDITTFLSGGFRENLDGLVGGKLSARGPYNTGGLALTVGVVYTFVCGVGPNVAFPVAARVSNLTPSTDVEGVAEISISATITGAFAPTVS